MSCLICLEKVVDGEHVSFHSRNSELEVYQAPFVFYQDCDQQAMIEINWQTFDSLEESFFRSSIFNYDQSLPTLFDGLKDSNNIVIK